MPLSCNTVIRPILERFHRLQDIGCTHEMKIWFSINEISGIILQNFGGGIPFVGFPSPALVLLLCRTTGDDQQRVQAKVFFLWSCKRRFLVVYERQSNCLRFLPPAHEQSRRVDWLRYSLIKCRNEASSVGGFMLRADAAVRVAIGFCTGSRVPGTKATLESLKNSGCCHKIWGTLRRTAYVVKCRYLKHR